MLSFLTAAKFYNLGDILGKYQKGVLTQKRSFLVICTTFRSAFHVSWKNQNKHSTLNSSFNGLSKWHEPDIKTSNQECKIDTLFLINIQVWNYPASQYQTFCPDINM